jgi:hypothetical protein
MKNAVFWDVDQPTRRHIPQNGILLQKLFFYLSAVKLEHGGIVKQKRTCVYFCV